MLFRLSWRNIWRQKRRTLITAMSVALALCLSLFTRSLQEGTYSSNIDNAARFYTGLIQVQHPDFSESMSIDDLIEESGTLVDVLKSEQAITTMLPRIESVALGAHGEKSKGVLVLGVNPELENHYSGIESKVKSGNYLSSNDNAVLVGEGLARYLELTVGDELILYGQGYRGQTASGLYEVKGVIHYPLSDLDSQIVYMPLNAAQKLYSTEGNITSWVLHTEKLNGLAEIVDDLEKRINQDVNIRLWEDLAPELAQQIAMDKAGGIFLIYVLYGVVGFGLFATIMMMTLERRREFSVMLATGMHRLKIVQLLLLESFYIGFIGICMGIILASPVLIYFYYHPITLTGETAQLMIDSGFEPVMPVSLSPHLLLDQIWAVSLLLLLSLLYPLYFLWKLDLVSGLKGGRHAG
ncbi:FtsX-like permease family protein [Vibrio hannami]|uniref:ABC transporter permease n=1 Tax=Vibrio hannami TaxID=2717094 RepID=UPI00240F9B7C|nr:FtsX-like permease family protein [Vibrio hannami]MDG3085404.1 FtsX-like permease family protein [Vibrio hannami]